MFDTLARVLKEIEEYGFENSQYYKNVRTLLSLLSQLSDEEWKKLGELADNGNEVAIFLICFYEARVDEREKKRLLSLINPDLISRGQSIREKFTLPRSNKK